jgi:hypothetical protein
MPGGEGQLVVEQFSAYLPRDQFISAARLRNSGGMKLK